MESDIATEKDNTDVFQALPTSIRSWNDINLDKEDGPWEALRPFFLGAGYDLFVKVHCGCEPRILIPPAADSFGLYGDRNEKLVRLPLWTPKVYAARDRRNRDVIIKLVGIDEDGAEETEILKFLNSDALRSNSENATTHVVEFLSYRDRWHFAVMPFCYQCRSFFDNADQLLEFTEQILSALTFLHQNRIAHLDVSYENILLNYHGPPIQNLRSSFPVQYSLIDFGLSRHFSLDFDPPNRLMSKVRSDRMQKPQELDGIIPIDPFAADVYQTARMLYAWFHKIIPDFPEFLLLLQDMSSIYPPKRISIMAARDRFRILRSRVCKEKALSSGKLLIDGKYPPVPMGAWRRVRDYALAFLELIKYKLMVSNTTPM